MNRDDIVTLIVSNVEELKDGEKGAWEDPVTESTVLFGREGIFDSLKLVTLIIDLEQTLESQGISITVSDERAVSQKHSPFQTVQSLADYVCQLIDELQHVRA